MTNLRQAIYNFLKLAPDTRIQIMRNEFDWQGSLSDHRTEVQSMMAHIRVSGQRDKFIARFVNTKEDTDT